MPPSLEQNKVFHVRVHVYVSMSMSMYMIRRVMVMCVHILHVYQRKEANGIVEEERSRIWCRFFQYLTSGICLYLNVTFFHDDAIFDL